MSDLLSRAASYFIAPTKPAADEAAGPPCFAPRAVVLGKAAGSLPVAAALANELRSRARARCGLLAVWDPGGRPPRPGPAVPAARRLAEKLEARGLPAGPRGRLAWLALPADPGQAAAAIARAAAAVDVPTVVAAAGPRCGAVDDLLDDQDLIVVVPPARGSETVAELALASLGARRAPAVPCPPLPQGATRLLALAGLGRLRAGGDAVRTAVRALR